jgi:AcrR family transcriptional regulator
VESEREDRRVRRTRRALQEALRDLMLQKPYDRITVQDVLDRADVGRATFYAHFRDKDALLMSEFEAMREALHEHLATFPRTQEHASDPGIGVARAVFEHAAARRGEYRALVRSRSGGTILKFAHQELTSLMREHLGDAVAHGRFKPVVPVEVTAEYVAGALLSVLIWWLDHDVPYPAEEMGRMFARLTHLAVGGSLGMGQH